jgi:hypothetical protein
VRHQGRLAVRSTGALVLAIEHGETTLDRSWTLPATLFIDPDGYLFCYVSASMSRGELRHRIEHFLAATAPGVPSPSPSGGRTCSVSP